MKRTILLSILAIAACGGGDKKADTTPKNPDDDEAAQPAATAAATKPDPEPAAPAEPPAPPPPKSFHASAELKPLKGVKLKGTTVTFAQTEGEEATVTSNGWFDGIKPGSYHLVVHEGADCGANGAKPGKPIATSDMPFKAAKAQDSLDIGKVATIQLDGDAAIVGHSLVLHADAKGKPGKPLACGPIATSDQ
jgi:hypothetical protein